MILTIIWQILYIAAISIYGGCKPHRAFVSQSDLRISKDVSILHLYMFYFCLWENLKITVYGPHGSRMIIQSIDEEVLRRDVKIYTVDKESSLIFYPICLCFWIKYWYFEANYYENFIKHPTRKFYIVNYYNKIQKCIEKMHNLIKSRRMKRSILTASFLTYQLLNVFFLLLTHHAAAKQWVQILGTRFEPVQILWTTLNLCV